MDIFTIFYRYREALLGGLWVTLTISAWVWLLGIAGGTAMGALAARFPAGLGRIVRAVTGVATAIPALVLLFWLHYPLQQVLHIVVSPMLTTIAALSFVNIFAVAEIVRSGLDDFPSQYLVAAKVCGLETRTRLTRILLPLIFRQLLPGVLLLQVTMLQATIFGSLISVDELFRVTQRINSQVYRPILVYTGLALFFLAICLPVNLLGSYLRRHYAVLTSDR